MKKIKKGVVSFVTLFLIMIFSPTLVLAALSDEADTPEELYGIAENRFATEGWYWDEPDEELIRKRVKGIIISTDNAIVEHNGESAYVDVIAVLNNGKYINVTDESDYCSENDQLVSGYRGRIFASKAPVETSMVIKYGPFKKKIHVSVLRYVDLDSPIEEYDEEDDDEQEDGQENEVENALKDDKEETGEEVTVEAKSSLSNADRDKIVEKAKTMAEITWTPAKNLNAWGKADYFKKGKQQVGIPYSQTYYQSDDTKFKEALADPERYSFYSDYKINNKHMPKYGSDCSRFVSYALGINRTTTYYFVEGIKNGTYKKVGTYNLIADEEKLRKDLKKAYKKLKKGDAVVYWDSKKAEGHTFIIISNTGKSVKAYEQTPMLAKKSNWKYSKLLEKKYLPFSRK